MIEKQLRKESEILAVYWILVAIYFKNCHFEFLIPVDLIAWGVVEGTDLRVTPQLNLQTKETKTKIANVEAIQVVIVDWVRTKVPCISGIFT